jgi:hypothetical protein
VDLHTRPRLTARLLIPLLLVAALEFAPTLWSSNLVFASGDANAPELERSDCPDGRTLDRVQLTKGWPDGQGAVLVYDAGGKLRKASDPATAVDFSDETWLFDHDVDGRAELVVVFLQAGGESVALLFDDQDGDGRVSYGVADCRLEVTESPFWTARAAADGPWILPDGRTNLNLRVEIDGHLEREIGKGLFSAGVLGRLARDGSVDTEWVVRDQDHDGSAEFAYARLLTPLNQNIFAVWRFVAWVNEGQVVSGAPNGYVYWPLLAGSYKEHNYFDTPPYFAMDWTAARLVDFGLHGYPTEQGYHVNSLLPVDPDAFNETDFESPMAYYDLADDHDGEPELHARFEIYPPRDPNLRVARSDQTIVDARYSWNLQNLPGLHWDYKLGLVGRLAPPGEVTLGDLRLRLPDYSTLPAWIVNSHWDWGTFVANEGATETSSEGIYELAGDYPGYRQYLIGQSENSPEQIALDLPTGLRGEWAMLDGPPRLYLDSVDWRLHLVNVRLGQLLRADGRQLQYSGVGDGPVDTWSLLSQGELLETLHVAAGQALFRDEQGAAIKAVSSSRPVSPIAPPSSHQAWSELRQVVLDHGPSLPEPNPADLFAYLGGNEDRLPGADLRGFRRTATGFETILDLKNPVDSPQWLAGRSAAAYLVRYSGESGYHIEPYVPAGPAVASFELLSETNLVQGTPLGLRVVIHNPDLLAAESTELRIVARSEAASSQDAALSADELVFASPDRFAIPAGAVADRMVSWTPPSAGAWELKAELTAPGFSGATTRTVRINVAADHLALTDSLTLFGQRAAWLAPTLLAAALALGALLYRLVLGQLSSQDLV